MYAISYMWYAVIGTFTCVLVGIVLGIITGTEKDAFDEQLLHPVVAKIARWMPGPKRTYINTKVEEKDDKESSEKTEVTEVATVPEAKPDIFTTTNSRLFDVYEARSPSPARTRL